MSEREQWKMLHLLYYTGSLSRAALDDAGIGGAHYHEYDPGDLAAGYRLVKEVLEQWARDNHAAQVKALRSW